MRKIRMESAKAVPNPRQMSVLYALFATFCGLIPLEYGREAQAATTGWSSQPGWMSSGNSSNGGYSRSGGGGYETPSSQIRKSSVKSEINSQVAPFAPGSHNFALDVGQVFLMGDLAGRYTDNIGTRLHYTYGVSDMFSFDTSLGLSDHGDGRFSMLSLLPGLRMNLAWYDKVIPYAVFGMGFYKPTYQLKNGTLAPATGTPLADAQTLSSVLFGMHMGPGIDLELSKQLFFGASLTFHNMFGAIKALPSGGVVDIGGTYTSFLIHAGFTF